MDTFKPGDIVAFITHPFFQDEFEIVFSGDPLQQSPLMIIADQKELKVDKTKDRPDEMTRNFIFLCYWFSQKSQKFESTWLKRDTLKLLESYDERLVQNLEIGDKAIFRTSNIEIKKKKSAFQFKIDANGNDLIQLTSIMSFVSPLLVIVDKISSDDKSGKKEGKNNPNENRTHPARFFKVKWFNLSADKFSETVLPIAALKRLPNEPIDKIKEIRAAIKNNIYLKTQLNGISTFLKPLTITYLNGCYLLRAENILSGRVLNDLKLEEFEEFKSCSKISVEHAPLYDFTKSPKPTLYPLDLIKKAAKNKSIIRIKYLNQQGAPSSRCVRDFSVYEFGEDEQKEAYLSGFCLSKNDIRHFNTARIESVEILDL